MKKLRVAIVQVSAGGDIARNLRRVAALVGRLPEVDLVALPEVFGFRGNSADYRDSAERLNGRVISEIAALARKRRCWILAGSVIEKARGKIHNTSALLNRSGKIVAAYRKIHLFEARLDDGTRIRESDCYDAGSAPVLADLEGWRVGMSICYDLRFPELFRRYSKEGANLFFVPSNFTTRTGKDHWEVLLRARAIENECFVVAPNQCGENPASGVASYGHSMAVGPWGETLREAGDRETAFVVELDPRTLAATRRHIPVLKHRTLG